MRIVLCGGFIDYELQLGKAISKQCELLILLPMGELSKELQQSIGSNINYYYTFKNINPRNFLDRIRNIFYTLRTVHRFKPDLVHLQLGGSILDFSIFMYCYILRIPTVITCHDVHIHVGDQHPFATTFVRYILRKYSDAIIVHGEKLRMQMIKDQRVPAYKVYSLHIGEHEVAPFKIYERSEIEEHKNSVLFFGRIYEYKGLEYLIKAEPIVTNTIPDFKIVIAGKGENFKKYNDMIRPRKEHFIVHNYRISYKEGAELFQRSSLVVLPYIEASQSGVIPTAYSFKKPVVATDVGSIPEVVDEGKTGLIVPPRDSQALADAIIKLLHNVKLRKEMGENAFIKLKRDFSWDNIGMRTVDIYKNILSQKRSQ